LRRVSSSVGHGASCDEQTQVRILVLERVELAFHLGMSLSLLLSLEARVDGARQVVLDASSAWLELWLGLDVAS
jgi:hypothetical protein